MYWLYITDENGKELKYAFLFHSKWAAKLTGENIVDRCKEAKGYRIESL